ncbi:MAG: DUF11 domain-containing protein [Planctomycetaceae bacterium]|nr:DUF11 domain-containing protein [Planctomycetaceae bacterium]
MRPWMKLLAVVGVVGVALGVSLAAEKPAERRAGSPTNASRPGLEYFSRGGATTGQSDLPADPVVEELAAEVSAAPKRFVRSKTEPTETATTTKKLSSAKTINGGARSPSEPKPYSRSPKAPLKEITDDVEFLTAPETELADEAPITGKLIAKKPASGIQPASFNAKPANLTDNDDEVPTDDVVSADFQQKPQTKPKVLPARAEQSPASTALSPKAPGLLAPATKPSRVSVVNDRSVKSLPPTAGRSNRASIAGASETSGTPSVSVEWVSKGGINVGQECACDLVVKNTGKISARQVVVEALFPQSVRLTQADPQPAEVADHLEWSIPELAAGEERTIHIKMIPSQRGELATTASVRFTGTAANVFKVEEPLLKLAVEAPAEIIVGDPLVQSITINNPGTGAAQNVKIQVTTPKGLEATRGDRSQIEIGTLNSGESRTVRLSFTAIAGGEQTLEVVATADSGLKQAAETTVNVIAPALKIAVEGPGLRYAGRDARYTLTITNEGKAATNNIHVTHRVPKGFKFVKADKGGSFDADHSSVKWFIGHLEPSQTAQVKLHLQAHEIGQFEHHVAVTAEHGATAKADTMTKVEGSASLVMEIQDLDDPIEIGQETAYEVRISNTGSKAAENVGLTFELPNGIELIKVEAATKHLAKSGLILFNDLPELAPGKTALFRIHVKGNAEGNLRVRARLTSESIEQELISEELTKFYAE